MFPASDDHNIVTSSNEVALLAKVNGVLHSGVHIIQPSSVQSGLVIVERNAASEDLELPGHLGVPGHGQDGAVGLVLAHQVGGGPGGGQHDDGGGLALVGCQDCGDGCGGGVVTGRGVLQ